MVQHGQAGDTAGTRLGAASAGQAETTGEQKEQRRAVEQQEKTAEQQRRAAEQPEMAAEQQGRAVEQQEMTAEQQEGKIAAEQQERKIAAEQQEMTAEQQQGKIAQTKRAAEKRDLPWRQHSADQTCLPCHVS